MVQESQPVEVTLGLTLQSILDVDMDKGILTSLAWLNMEWNDPSLTWWNSDLKDVRTNWFWIFMPLCILRSWTSGCLSHRFGLPIWRFTMEYLRSSLRGQTLQSSPCVSLIFVRGNMSLSQYSCRWLHYKHPSIPPDIKLQSGHNLVSLWWPNMRDKNWLLGLQRIQT